MLQLWRPSRGWGAVSLKLKLPVRPAAEMMIMRPPDAGHQAGTAAWPVATSRSCGALHRAVIHSAAARPTHRAVWPAPACLVKPLSFPARGSRFSRCPGCQNRRHGLCAGKRRSETLCGHEEHCPAYAIGATKTIACRRYMHPSPPSDVAPAGLGTPASFAHALPSDHSAPCWAMTMH